MTQTSTTRPSQPIRLFGFPLSGHAHRAALMLSLLDLPFEKIDVDLRGGAHKTPAFLARNPFGQVPVLEDGDTVIADSNAILTYLALRYDQSGQWLPRDAVQAAKVQQWLSVAAGQLAHGPALARLITLFGLPSDPAPARDTAAQLFAVMEATLGKTAWLVGAKPTIADVALYSYTAHAPEGGVFLDDYPAIQAWLARLEALSGFIGMQRSPVPKAA
jgi:glutathione S-transferase